MGLTFVGAVVALNRGTSTMDFGSKDENELFSDHVDYRNFDCNCRSNRNPNDLLLAVLTNEGTFHFPECFFGWTQLSYLLALPL
jgi:hypothetical protein